MNGHASSDRKYYDIVDMDSTDLEQEIKLKNQVELVFVYELVIFNKYIFKTEIALYIQ